MLIPKLKPIGTIITLCIVSLLSPVSYFSTHSHAVGANAAILSQTPAATKLELPVPSGPFAVGRIAYHWTDSSYREPFSLQMGAPREVMVYVWYPAAKSKVAGQTAPYLPDFSAAQKVVSEADLKSMFRPTPYSMIQQSGLPLTHTVEKTKISSLTAKYPLLVFSHGWGNTTLLYTAELEDLASHGYVVAAIDHPYDTTFTIFPGPRVVLFAQEKFDTESKKPNGLVDYAKERVEEMATDTRFVIDKLTQYDKKASLGAPFAGHLDLRRVGSFGHSIGGLAAVRACQIDKRLRACMNQDSDVDDGAPFILTTSAGKSLDQPLLFFAINGDKFSQRVVNPKDEQLVQMKLTRAEFNTIILRQQKIQNEVLASVRGGSYRVTMIDMPGISHRSFSDLTLMSVIGDATNGADSLHNYQIIQSYTRAFFDKYLKSQKDSLLDQKSSLDPLVRVDRFSPAAQ
jgi:hypothetical protein